MRRAFSIAALAAATLICGQAEAKSKLPPEPARCDAPWDNTTWQQFNRGNEFARREAMRYITQKTRAPKDAYNDIRACADQLQVYYDARAGRQQTFLNFGTLVVLLGTTGAALSGGAGATTQGYWTGGAVAPGVLSQFYANEPTRDLFHSASTTLAFMGRRYDEILRVTEKLREGWAAGSVPSRVDYQAACTALQMQAGRMLSWGDNADRAALQPDVDRLLAGCAAADSRNDTLESFRGSADVWAADIARLYGEDIIGLDQQLRVQDRVLRYSPTQAVSAVLAAPFLTVGSVLSSDDAKSAVDTIKAQAAIQSLKVAIAPVPVTAAPELATLPDPVSASARLRLGTASKAGEPPREDVKAVLDTLDGARAGLLREAPQFNARAMLARQVSLAARTWSISPRFDTSTRSISLVLTNDGGMFEITPPQ